MLYQIYFRCNDSCGKIGVLLIEVPHFLKITHLFFPIGLQLGKNWTPQLVENKIQIPLRLAEKFRFPLKTPIPPVCMSIFHNFPKLAQI